MTDFITRIELHDASWSDYVTLHRQMETQGFQRTIRSDQGATYHLPTAEYAITGTLTASDVLERAKAAAATTSKPFGALVTTAGVRTWYGLPTA